MHIRSAIRRVAGIIPLLPLIGACRDAGPAVTLRLHLRPGSTYHVWTTTEQSVMGTEQAKQSIGLGIVYSVEDVDSAGVARLRVRYDSVAFASEGPDGRQSFTSSDTSSEMPAAAAAYMAIVGQGFVMRIAPDGRVRGIEGADSLRRAVAERLAASNRFLTGVAQSYMGTIFGDSALVESMEQSFAIYPPGPVSVGSTWESTADVASSFPITLHNDYELASRAGGVATIEVTSKIESSHAPPVGSSPIMRFEYDLQGKQKATLRIREEDGWVISSEATQEFAGTIRQGEGADSTKKIEYPVSVRGSVTTKLVNR